MLSQYGQETFDQYNCNFSLSHLELCSYYESGISLSLSIDALPSSTAMTTLAKDLHQGSSDASGTNHDGAMATLFARLDAECTYDSGLSSEQHYKDNNNSLKKLAKMCCCLTGGVKFGAEPGSILPPRRHKSC